MKRENERERERGRKRRKGLNILVEMSREGKIRRECVRQR